MVISRDSLVETSDNGAVRIAFFSLANLENILPGFNGHFLNSQVIGAAIPAGRNMELARPVIMSLKHKLITEEVRNPVCASWDFVQSAWTSANCRMLKTTTTQTTCECDSLSMYAVLMEAEAGAIVTSAYTEREEETGLVIALSCVAVSLGFLAITLGLLYFKRQSLGLSKGVIGCSTNDSGFYPPLAGAAASPGRASSHYRSSSRDKSSQQINTIYKSSLFPQQQAMDAGNNKTVLVPYTPEMYAHIYSEIDPRAVAASRLAANLHRDDDRDLQFLS